MFIPLPVLIPVVLAVLFCFAWLLRRRAGRDRLMGVAPLRPGRAIGAGPVRVATMALSPEVEAQVRALLVANRKIEAIKVAREATGLGLKETKDFVEALQ